VSYNKFIAKLASDQNKPDGLCVIPPHKGAAFVAGLPVKRFHGVGPVTARRMEALGILTGADLRDRSLEMLQRHFGSYASYLYQAARGEDHRPVRAHREAKSIGAERTFERDLSTREELHAQLARVAEAAWARVERHEAHGRTVTLKLRRADFSTITRARSSRTPVADQAGFLAIGRTLLDAQLPVPGGIRLLGLTLSALTPAGLAEPDPVQPSLF
jgi:DNA polymerase-4